MKIKFKARQKSTRDWIYATTYNELSGFFHAVATGELIPDTVRQFTGIIFKGKEVYDRDTLMIECDMTSCEFKVFNDDTDGCWHVCTRENCGDVCPRDRITLIELVRMG